MQDCGTENSITAEPAVNDGEVVASLSARIMGRIAAEDICNPENGEVITTKGDMVDELMADRIDEWGLQSARIRSPLTCEAEEGVCAN